MSKELKVALQAAEGLFKKANEANLVSWSKESGYVGQILRANKYLTTCEPRSIQDAIVNVAAIGISLNPALKLAYLVPRDGKCVLDISYMGLIKLATDTGSILWARADIVYQADTFEYRGPCEAPVVKADPFCSDRGSAVGAYCVAKTAEGDLLTEVMTKDELDAVRSKSMAYVKRKSGPWVEWWSEMAKKTVIKRASKTWPKTDRLSEAIHVLDQHEGFTDDDFSGKVLISDEELRTLEAAIADFELDESIVLRALRVAALDQLPAEQFNSALRLIQGAKAA